MPIKYNYTTNADKYAQLYRLQELLRIAFNNGIINQEQLEIRQNEITKEILKFRTQIKNDNTINTNINDLILV